MNQKLNRQNLLQHELIGLPVKVVRSFNVSQENAEGEVVDETMKMLIIGTGQTKRMIAKEGTIFQFELTDGTKADVNGEQILRRPEDRVKMTRGRRL